MAMRILLLCVASLLGACAHSPADDPQDPLEGMNRAVYGFNEVADKYVAQPVARGYVKVLPGPVRTGVTNFFSNLTYPTVIVNSALQGKLAQAGIDTSRFLVNTTFGIGGLLDAASRVGLEANDEDFGQTLGYWGVGQGWYLMLPILGPSTNRDLVGRVGSAFTDPVTYMNSEVSIPLTVVNAVDSRAQLLGTEAILEQQFDRYAFIRGIYLQRRQFLVYDGNPPKEEIDYGDDDEEETEPESP
jgi:phospholipid-binding lipoprotein MlaA